MLNFVWFYRKDISRLPCHLGDFEDLSIKHIRRLKEWGVVNRNLAGFGNGSIYELTAKGRKVLEEVKRG